MASNSSNYFFILGQFVAVFFAYFIRDFRLLYCAYTSVVVLMLTYFWQVAFLAQTRHNSILAHHYFDFSFLRLVPESPRWLMVNGKKDKAFKIFARVAKSNKRCLDELQELKMLNPGSVTSQEMTQQSHVKSLIL